MKSFLYLALISLALLAGCSPASSSVAGIPASAIPPAITANPTGISEPTEEAQPVATTAPTPGPSQEAQAALPTASETSPEPAGNQQPAAPSPTARPTLAPGAWKELPAIPTASETAKQIYQRGQELGNNPHAFSKIGDCQNVSAFFLAFYDESPEYYSLGPYAPLKETIDWFAGSFKRESAAVKGGFNGAALMSPLRADPKRCQKGEFPLSCELREQKPAFAIISLETWWSKKPAEVYEKYLRQVLDYTISQGVVPIVATKADNLERDESINATVAKVASEYDIPLWNFWAAVQPLPNHGLTADRFHLTFAGNFFDDPKKMESAWPVRNLTGLQALDAVWRGVTGQAPLSLPAP